MSDKSFGDCPNRNIVKNPLLSTAVTGLSIEDLTHNAILVPVAATQGLITRSDHQIGSHNHTLRHSDHEFTNFPSGDSNTNVFSPQTTTTPYPPQIENPQPHYFDKKPEIPSSTVSKATPKSEDDFDVNEYFARLQGTRYVSAPINSNTDQNSNIPTEDNLEEINLNDDKNPEVQQSLTADIAQNFSQLPTVLPHVASAVFSSFSNMLSYKSREQTPDESQARSQGFQEVSFQSPGSGHGFVGQTLGVDTPVMAEEVKEVAPPPKEPPVCGSSNFRITTRKKYAQIPGLSSGTNFETSQKIELNPLTKNFNNYFIPTPEENIKTEPIGTAIDVKDSNTEAAPPNIQETYNIFSPITDFNASDSQPNVFEISKENEPKPIEELPPPPLYASQSTNAANNAIPPPPMFSSQRPGSITGKSVLPPSVARRIGSNHPVMKQQAMPTINTANIFVPTFDPMSYPSGPGAQTIGTSFSETHGQPVSGEEILVTEQPASQHQDLSTPNIPPPAQFTQPSPGLGASPSAPSSVISPPSNATLPPQNVFSPIANIAPPMFAPTLSSNTPTMFVPPTVGVDGNISSKIEASLPLSSNIFSPITAQVMPPPPGPIQPPKMDAKPNIGPTTLFTPPFYNPIAVQEPPKSGQTFAPEPPKPLIEPPKATGAVNYRLNKKRPQYYSGPIEGVGSISNSIKPVIPSIDSRTFHGALFTPEQQQTDQSIPSSVPFDLNKPTETVPLVPQYNIGNPLANAQPSAFNINQAGTYTPFDITHPVQNIEPQYNTGFDLSRSTTDSYEYHEEPKESKGFGIIGSLKSKLSSIDINKIQHSVTTFFDPAYNEPVKEETSAQQNAPYAKPSYPQAPQTNLEIFVPNVQQNPHPYNFDFHQHQNSIYLNNEYYGYPNFQNQSQPEAGHCSNQHHYPSHSPHPKPYADAQHGYPDQSKESSLFQFSIPHVSPQGITEKLPDPVLQNITGIFDNTQHLKPEKKTENVAPAEPEPTKIFESKTAIEERFATSFFDLAVQKPVEIPKAEEKAMPNVFIPEVTPDRSLISEPFGLHTQKLEQTVLFNPNTVNLFANTTIDSKKTNVEKPSKVFEVFKNEEHDTIPTLEAQRVVLFENIKNENINKAAIVDKIDETPKSNDDFKTHDFFPNTTFDNTEVIAKDSIIESLSKDTVPILGVSSVPLFGLTEIGQEKIPDELIKTLSDKKSSLSFFDHAQKVEEYSHKYDPLNQNTSYSYFENVNTTPKVGADDIGVLSGESSASFFENVDASYQDTTQNVFENQEKENSDEIRIDSEDITTAKDNASELSICEICREVNTPDVKDDDQNVTNQLIENITSPIQLSNAVEASLLEPTSLLSSTNTALEKIEAAEQFDEISHITEETIDTIQVQSATELLEDVDEIKAMNYEWTNESALREDYKFNDGPNPIGFYTNTSLIFDKGAVNADEKLLARQMSIASAPPAEEDSKSDETGVLDVHSIEQDANKDFPIFEEFVIEPEGDDKDLKDNTDNELDSFTNRVEKYKSMDPTETMFFEIAPQPISMVSYFDTGNYAVETHYRNTNTKPAPSIPPGFEEEFKRRVALAKQREEKIRKEMNTVPDTTTQTRTTTVATYCSSRVAPSYTKIQPIVPVGFDIEDNITSLVDEQSDPLEEFSTSPDMPSKELDKDINDETEIAQDVAKALIIEPEVKQEAKLPEFTNIFGLKPVEKQDAETTFLAPPTFITDEKITKIDDLSTAFCPKLEEKSEPNLPPFAAFANPKPESEKPKLPDPINFFSDTPNDPPESFSRLASYFSAPPKTDHAKSFFELSQSQNHYRHASTAKIDALMKDLTSVQNLAVPKDHTLRHVNYFTVEYDTVLPDFKGQTSKDMDDNNDTDLDRLVSNCRYCTNIFHTSFKVRTAVNDNSEQGNTPKMESRKESGRGSVTVNFDGLAIQEEPNECVAGMTENRSATEYCPVRHHWFYRVDVEDKSIWRGFSIADSRALETAYLNPDLNDQTLVPTDGGRYDVNIMGRLRIPVYWVDKPTNVRRCSWFYKGTTDARYVPYTEQVAEKLEEEYRHGMTTQEWHRRLVLANGEVVVMHGPSVMVHFLHSDAFSSPPLFSFGKRVYRNPPKIRVSRDQPEKIDHLILLVHGAGEYKCQKEKNQSSSRPRVVRRGHDESEIEDTEPSSIDHLLLLCHGVGSACDMRFRSVEEVVEDFRATSLQLIQSHYRNSYDQGIVSRVEVLPISWHATLHSGETGVDRRLSQITLDSIPRLRSFTNDTVLDVLFYTSPVFCQTILDTVCKELNRIYEIFLQRNPSFKGGVSLGGHSLGSVILYDLLCHQNDLSTEQNEPLGNKSYVKGPAGTGQLCVHYPSLAFAPDALYALGSPIAIFECIRGVESLGASFSLPTCKNFFNIFHPYDPIAYRIEPLINPVLRDLKPFLIPHHKGRKRMHLELKDTMARVGADLKQKLLESLKSTWNKWKSQPPTDGQLEKVVEEEMEKEQLTDDSTEQLAREKELSTPDILGRLNGGRRVDYVLQEAPLEMINEYLFAMSSHVGYWESEDTMLLMLREIYSSLGVQPDSTVPQQNMLVQRTKTKQDDEAIVLKASDYPSTSRGAI